MYNIHVVHKDERSLSDSFNSVHWWLMLNGLSLNPDKSEAIIIGTGARQRSESPLNVIDLGDVQIQPPESDRRLGVVTHVLTFCVETNGIPKNRNYWNSIHFLSRDRNYIHQNHRNSLDFLWKLKEFQIFPKVQNHWNSQRFLSQELPMLSITWS